MQSTELLGGAQWKGRLWYAYGTSMTAPVWGHYVPFVEAFSGLKVVNRGNPGEGLTRNIGGYAKTGLTLQRVKDLSDGKEAADLITLEVGPNDAGAPLGSIYDNGEDSFCGCLNQAIRFLQQHTAAQIVVLSMTGARYSPADGAARPPEFVYGSRKEGYTRLQMNRAIRDVAELNNVYYIPAGEGSGLGQARVGAPENVTYLKDQIHLTELGGFNMALAVWSRLKDIPRWYSALPEE